MRPAFWLLLLLVGRVEAADSAEQPFPAHPGFARFVQEIAERVQLTPEAALRLFSDVRLEPRVLAAMARPAEARPWDAYRPLFVNEVRVQAGLAFWARHGETLARAQERFGVPAPIILAILGVETFYGRNTGRFRVLDALTTLAVDYPPRADYFRSELIEYLRLTQSLGIDPRSVRGSYAGAMGIAQFMPSSCRQFGVDFDGDGMQDLWANVSDSVGSVAHYLQSWGWQADRPVAVPVRVTGEATREQANTGWSTRLPVAAWQARGVHSEIALDPEQEAMLLRLDTANGPEFWLAFQNFYVLTRYNRSVHYAMAVWQLAQALAAARGQGMEGR